MKAFKQCTGCATSISRSDWDALPPARGGLLAMGGEWRNHGCGSTLLVMLEELTTETVNPAAEMGAR